MTETPKNTLDEKLLTILACPKCKQKVRQDGDWVVCDVCRLKYPIHENIPYMTADDAVSLDEE